jgi:hypothetical protein
MLRKYTVIHSLSFSADIENMWSFTSVPPYVSLASGVRVEIALICLSLLADYVLLSSALEEMHLKWTGPKLSCDQKHDRAVATKWRQVDEASIPKDEVIIVMPEMEQPTFEFFDELKPVIYTMKIFGLFPLQKRNPG